ncbi:hypothetical protein CKAN_01506100 [Cinnamomum micranthum f. kanehirae]|uniref:Uncharacterized protein n=1 Tax=Cinnamomum micranthum f. kanehirae TaxID=337451 RepID=A0A443P639_9MAGN|nr:hypothetical protein CKAN_01506100 [Cinnamomum micranthum f. kanehirae]
MNTLDIPGILKALPVSSSYRNRITTIVAVFLTSLHILFPGALHRRLSPFHIKVITTESMKALSVSCLSNNTIVQSDTRLGGVQGTTARTTSAVETKKTSGFKINKLAIAARTSRKY